VRPNNWSVALGRKLRVQSSLIGILIGLGCLALLLRLVNLKDSWHALGRLSGPFMLFPFIVFCLNVPLRAWRWRLIFPAGPRPGLSSCVVALGIGNMANFLLPGRAGDIARSTLVGPTGSVLEGTRTLATIAVEKVLDGLALIGMVLFSIWTLHPPPWVILLLRTAVLIFASAVGLLLILRYRTHTIIGTLRRGFHWLGLSSLEERFDGVLTAFADGLSGIASREQFIILILFTGAIWTTEASLVWGLSRAIRLSVTMKSSVVATAILGLGLMVPAAPGGLGTYELLGTEAFKLAGIHSSDALALTVVIHAWVFVANVVAGLALLGIKGMNFAQLSRQFDIAPTVQRDGVQSGARRSL
jgi:glycosyltransferase 2 family protein